MNKHPANRYFKNGTPPPDDKFCEYLHYTPKNISFDLGVAGKEILTLSALYRSCQFLPLSDRTIRNSDIFAHLL